MRAKFGERCMGDKKMTNMTRQKSCHLKLQQFYSNPHAEIPVSYG